MAEIEQLFSPTLHCNSHEDTGETVPRVMVVGLPIVLPAIVKNLGGTYDTYGLPFDSISHEQIGKLAMWLLEDQPDAIVTLVLPSLHRILLEPLDGARPLVLLDFSQGESPEVTRTTEHHRFPLRLSEVVNAVDRVINKAGRRS